MADQDPTQAQATPPFPEQEQEPPGSEAEMRPLADHGEDSYVGHGRLKDEVALITGADSGMGARWRSPSRARAPTCCARTGRRTTTRRRPGGS